MSDAAVPYGEAQAAPYWMARLRREEKAKETAVLQQAANEEFKKNNWRDMPVESAETITNWIGGKAVSTVKQGQRLEKPKNPPRREKWRPFKGRPGYHQKSTARLNPGQSPSNAVPDSSKSPSISHLQVGQLIAH
jgi:hypothetical protein